LIIIIIIMILDIDDIALVHPAPTTKFTSAPWLSYVELGYVTFRFLVCVSCVYNSYC